MEEQKNKLTDRQLAKEMRKGKRGGAGGKLLMQDRVLVGIDEEAENAHILEAAKKLWGDLNHRTY